MKKYTGILLVALILAGCAKSEPVVPGRWYTPSLVELGKKVYGENCVTCHQEGARGTLSWREKLPDGSYPPPPLNGTAHAWHHPITILKKVISEGGVPLGGKMPGFGSKLNDDEKLAAIAYFQSLWPDQTYQGWLQRGGLK